MYTLGLSKSVIDVPLIPVAMKGYGDWNNRVDGANTSLNARTLFVEKGTDCFFFTNVEILVITSSLKREVLKSIVENYPDIPATDDNLMLCSQHTHSAPSGYSEYGFHTMTTPGISTEITNSFRDAIVQSIVDAYRSKFTGELLFKEGVFDKDVPVAWNRSYTSYNNNKSINKVTWEQTDKALDRTMKMIEVKDSDWNTRGSVNWFGVHATSIGPKNTKISFDNKGYAAEFLEKEIENTVHVFAQGKSGDVSPHYHGPGQFKKRKEISKSGDHKYAEQNGKLQFKKAKELIELEGEKIDGNVDFVTLYFDYTKIHVSEKYTNGVEGCKTDDACIGAAMFQGTPIDGPGISKATAGLFTVINKAVNKKATKLKEAHGNKEIILNASKREFLGLGKLNVFPGFVDPQIKVTNKMAKIGSLDEHSLIPTILPIQLFLLGDIAMASLPIEITTVAGERLEESILKKLQSVGVTKVILCPYANAYAGYVTTSEEYDIQNYEGGHTIFGKWTLGALQTTFDDACDQIMLSKEKRKSSGIEQLPVFSKDQLAKRMYPFK